MAGNGGSACDALQLASLIESKPLSSGEFPRIDKNFLAIGYLTCCVNDGFSPFLRGIESVSSSKDVLIAYTTSGNSENIIEAVKASIQKGILTIVFTGYDGGKISGLGDYEFLIPVKSTGPVQEIHWTIGSILGA